jgi:hypothetical protein
LWADYVASDEDLGIEWALIDHENIPEYIVSYGSSASTTLEKAKPQGMKVCEIPFSDMED